MSEDSGKLPEPTGLVKWVPGGISGELIPVMHWNRHPVGFEEVYTAEQVREAMEQAKAQERERLFHLIRDDKTIDPIIDDLTKLRECTPGGHCHHVSGYALAEALADAIRNG
jgi:hypothetical protein